MDTELLKVLVGGGVGGVIAGWLLIKTIPALVTGFRAEMADARKMFAEELGRERDSHALQLRTLHTMMHERDAKLIEAVSDLTARK